MPKPDFNIVELECDGCPRCNKSQFKRGLVYATVKYLCLGCGWEGTLFEMNDLLDTPKK